MFRRRWSGLPPDAVFVSDLKQLGYFVNEDDEIRNLANPDCYFKFHLDKNDRINVRQRFHFNEAIQNIVHERLENEGLEKVLLPLGTKDNTHPHVPIFVSKNLKDKSRVIIVFGEPTQDLGNLALRVINGPGGINKGCMVAVVKHLNKQESSASDASPPGIILANLGELWWWPEGKRALGPTSAASVPSQSLVHYGRRYNAKINDVPENETQQKHIKYIFNKVVRSMVHEDARLDIMGIGLGSDEVEKFLDEEDVWSTWESRINAFAILGGIIPSTDLHCQKFKDFLIARGRAYICDGEPADTPLSGHCGNPDTLTFTGHGCPVLSSGEPYYIECILISNHALILDWLEKVAKTPGYRNPEVVVVNKVHDENEPDWAEKAWEQTPDAAKPIITFADTHELDEERKMVRFLKEYNEGKLADEPAGSDEE